MLHGLLFIALTANPYLDEARGLLDSMQYGQARAKLEYARKVTTSTRDEKREVFALLARAWAAEGKLDQAEAAFSELLADDPSAPAPRDAPPRIREAFRKAKEKLYPLDFVSLAQAAAPAGRVQLQVKDPWGVVSELSLQESTGEAFAPRVLTVTEGEAAAALTPPAPGVPTKWYVEARDGSKKLVASLGSAKAPFVFGIGEGTTVTPGGRSRVVPWVTAALTLAAVGVTAGVAAQGVADYGAAGSTASVGERQRLDGRARGELTAAWVSGSLALALLVTTVVLFVVW